MYKLFFVMYTNMVIKSSATLYQKKQQKKAEKKGLKKAVNNMKNFLSMKTGLMGIEKIILK